MYRWYVKRGGSLVSWESHPTVYQHDIPLLDPFLPQHPGQNFDLIIKLPICQLGFLARHWRLPYDGNIVTIAILDMAVDTVVRSRDLTVREPAPVLMAHTTSQCLGGAEEGTGWPLMPMQGLRMVFPKGVRFVKRKLMDSILRMLWWFGHRMHLSLSRIDQGVQFVKRKLMDSILRMVWWFGHHMHPGLSRIDQGTASAGYSISPDEKEKAPARYVV
jgi:hypothetical protein